MTFKEKSIAATLMLLVIVYGGYFLRLDWQDLPPRAVAGVTLAATIIPLVSLLIAAHIVLAILHGRRAEEEDERDRRIELLGIRVGFYVISAGAFLTFMGLLWRLEPVPAAYALLGAMVLAEIGKLATQLVLYLRGV